MGRTDSSCHQTETDPTKTVNMTKRARCNHGCNVTAAVTAAVLGGGKIVPMRDRPPRPTPLESTLEDVGRSAGERRLRYIVPTKFLARQGTEQAAHSSPRINAFPSASSLSCSPATPRPARRDPHPLVIPHWPWGEGETDGSEGWEGSLCLDHCQSALNLPRPLQPERC